MRLDVLLRSEVGRHGIPLVVRERRDRVRFAATAAVDHADLAPMLAEAGERFRRRLRSSTLPRGALRVTDVAPVLRKLADLRDHVARVRRRRPPRLEDLRDDVDRQDAIALGLLVAVRDAADIGVHMASDEGGTPVFYAGGFDALARHGVLDRGPTRAMGRAAGLRNRAVHGDGPVAVRRRREEIPEGLEAPTRCATRARGRRWRAPAGRLVGRGRRRP